MIIRLQRLLDDVLTAAFPGFSLSPSMGMSRAVIGRPISSMLSFQQEEDMVNYYYFLFLLHFKFGELLVIKTWPVEIREI